MQKLRSAIAASVLIAAAGYASPALALCVTSGDGVTATGAAGPSGRTCASFGVAVGDGAVAQGSVANPASLGMALGQNAQAASPIGGVQLLGGIAIGATSNASANYATALGSAATASGTNSVALGANSTDGGHSNVVSVGGVGSERRIINVAPGTNGTDAVNLNQLNAVDSSLSSKFAAIPAGISSVATDGTLKGNGTAASPLGVAPSVLNSITTAQNAANTARGLAQNSVQYDGPSHTSVTLNPGGVAAGLHNVAAGVISASSTDAINGAQLHTVQQLAGAGWNLQANGGPSTNIGPGATLNVVNGSNTVASPSGNTLQVSVVPNPTFAGMVTAAGGLTVGAGKPIDMGGNTAQHVAAGAIAASSTDAINGSQLYAVGSKVDNLGSSTASNLGGGSISNSSTGIVSAPSYQIANNTYNDVGSALGKLNQEINGSSPTIVRYDTDANGKPLNSVTLTGAQNGQPVLIHNVAPGSSGTDAVNLNQLNSVASGGRAYTDQQVSGLRGYVDNRFAGDEAQIAKANRTARAAGAAAMAAANLRYDGKPYAGSVAASLGGFMGRTAIASGVAYNWNSVRVNSSITYVPNTNAVGWGAGASWRFW